MFETFYWRHYIEIFFFGNQFCNFVSFTKIINKIFVFASEFFKSKSKDFIHGDINLWKIWKITGSIVLNISQDTMKFIKWVKETLPENKEKWRQNLFSNFSLHNYFIIDSKFWEKCTVFQLLFHLVTTFHSCYFWKSWVVQLYFSVWHIESKTNLQAKQQQYSFWSDSIVWVKISNFPAVKISRGFFFRGIMHFITQSALLDYSFHS